MSHLTATPWPGLPDSLTTLADPRAGWPDAGSTLTWRAVLHTVGSGSGEVEVRWSVDGTPVKTETLTVEDGGGFADLERPWSEEREWIEVELAGHAVDSAAASLRVPSDGLTIAFYLHDRVWRHIDRIYPGGVPGWASANVRRWNDILEAYAPPGGADPVRDRLRLDILRVHDGYLQGKAESDLRWLFWDGSDRRFANSGSSREQLENQTIVLHELIHQRGVADIYAYEVLLGVMGSRFDILDPDGSPALGTPRLPLPSNTGPILTIWPYFDSWLMGSDYSLFTRVSDVGAFGLNRVAGLRRTVDEDQWGNELNALHRWNDYLQQMPEEVEVVARNAGVPVPHAIVEVFPDLGVGPYDDVYDPEPEWVGTADDQGVVVVPGSVFRPRPDIRQGASTAVTAIVRVRDGERWGYGFIPGFDISQQVYAGATGRARVAVRVTLR